MNLKRYNQRDKIDQLLGSDLDVEAAWNEFDYQKRRKRPLLFWLIGVMSILLVSICTYSLIHLPIEADNSKSNSDIMADYKSPNSDGKPSLNQEEAISDKNNSDNIADYNSINPDDNISLSEEGSNSLKDKHEQLSKQQVNQKLSTNDQFDRQTNNINYSDINTHKIEKLLEIKDLALIPNENTKQGKETAFRKNNKTEQVELNLYSKQKLPFFEKNTLSLSQEMEMEKSESPVTNVTIAHSKMKFPLLPLLQHGGLNYDTKSQISLLPKVSVVTTALDQKSKYSLSLYSGIGAFTRSLAYSEDNLLQQRRRDNEKPFLSQTIGVGFNIELTDKLYLESGLSFTNNISRIRDIIQQTVSTEQSEDVLIAYQIKGGVSQNIFGTASVDNIEVVEKTRFQQYRSLSIPIALSYAQPINNRFRVELGAGLQYALLQSTIGETYNSLESIGEYGPVSDYGYKSSHHFEFRTHAGIRSYLSDQIEIGVRTTLLSDMNSRSSGVAGFSDRFNSFTISFQITTHL